MYNKDALAAALIRAKEIRAGTSRAGRAVSTRFLVDWSEGASRKSLDYENILELWARVLAQAPENFDPEDLGLVNALKNIGPDEARLFDNFYVKNAPIDIDSDGEDGDDPRLTAYFMEGGFLGIADLLFLRIERGDFDVNGKDILKSILSPSSPIEGGLIKDMLLYCGSKYVSGYNIDLEDDKKLSNLVRAGLLYVDRLIVSKNVKGYDDVWSLKGRVYANSLLGTKSSHIVSGSARIV
ncbi:MAG: hypothetical protein ACFBWO_14230 [Paracoccaceae bacterium]